MFTCYFIFYKLPFCIKIDWLVWKISEPCKEDVFLRNHVLHLKPNTLIFGSSYHASFCPFPNCCDYLISWYKEFMMNTIHYVYAAIPSLRARDCSKNEKEALNYLFLLIPLLNVIIPFFWKSFAFVWSADVVAFFGMYAWKVHMLSSYQDFTLIFIFL